MPIDSGGNISRPGPIPVNGQTALAEHVNTPVDDLYAAVNEFPFLDGRKTWRGNQDLNGYRFTNAEDAQSPQDYVTLQQMQDAIAAIATIPTGVLLPLTSLVVPTGWLVVNGQTVSRTTYAALWAHAQASGMLAPTEGAKTAGQFGPGNGVGTFSLPNLYADGGYFIRALTAGRTIGNVQADTVGPHPHPASFSGNAVPNHTHTYEMWDGAGNALGGGSQGSRQSKTTSPSGGHTPSGTVTVGNNTGTTETRPRNIAYPVIMKV